MRSVFHKYRKTRLHHSVHHRSVAVIAKSNFYDSTTTTTSSFVTQLREQIEYPHAGVLSSITEDQACQYTLLSCR